MNSLGYVGAGYILLLCVWGSYSTTTTTTEDPSVGTARCNAYCNENGEYRPYRICFGQPGMEVYCCGSSTYRECCTNATREIVDQPDDETTCKGGTFDQWYYYQWRVILGLLGTVIVMLSFAACCYYCCGGVDSRNGPRMIGPFGRQRSQGHPTIGPTGELDMSLSQFNPASEFAFQPPAYDSLSNSPPKYEEIYSMDNPGFNADEHPGPSSETSNPEESRENNGVGQSTNVLHPDNQSNVINVQNVVVPNVTVPNDVSEANNNRDNASISDNVYGEISDSNVTSTSTVSHNTVQNNANKVEVVAEPSPSSINPSNQQLSSLSQSSLQTISSHGETSSNMNLEQNTGHVNEQMNSVNAEGSSANECPPHDGAQNISSAHVSNRANDVAVADSISFDRKTQPDNTISNHSETTSGVTNTKI